MKAISTSSYRIITILIFFHCLVACKSKETEPEISGTFGPYRLHYRIFLTMEMEVICKFSFNKADDETRISEYRIIVVKSPNLISLSDAEQLPISRYQSVLPNGQNKTVTLPATFQDVLGNEIFDGAFYKAYVLSVADGTNAQNNTLSPPSNTVETTNREIMLEKVILSEMQSWNISSLAITVVANNEVVFFERVWC